MEEQLQQMKALSQTVEALISRNNELSKTLEETSSTLARTIGRMEAKIAEFEVVNRALQKSLNDSDQTVDDLVKVVSALLSYQKQVMANQQNVQSVPS